MISSSREDGWARCRRIMRTLSEICSNVDRLRASLFVMLITVHPIEMSALVRRESLMRIGLPS